MADRRKLMAERQTVKQYLALTGRLELVERERHELLKKEEVCCRRTGCNKEAVAAAANCSSGRRLRRCAVEGQPV